MHCYFTSDLHGNTTRYTTLYHHITTNKPDAVFIGGDLLPTHHSTIPIHDFITTHILTPIQTLSTHTKFFLILGNDDPRTYEPLFQTADHHGILTYIHQRTTPLPPYTIAGYAYVPPTPFLLKDWERYDVSHHDDVGTIPPTEGTHTVPFSPDELCHKYIAQDLEDLSHALPLEKTIFLFHSPPYQTALDRADLDGKTVDYAPLDVHVGSIAIKRFIETHQPLLTLHGHVHESTRLTKHWRITIGKTTCFNGSTDTPKLSLIEFDPAHLSQATRRLLD